MFAVGDSFEFVANVETRCSATCIHLLRGNTTPSLSSIQFNTTSRPTEKEFVRSSTIGHNDATHSMARLLTHTSVAVRKNLVGATELNSRFRNSFSSLESSPFWSRMDHTPQRFHPLPIVVASSNAGQASLVRRSAPVGW